MIVKKNFINSAVVRTKQKLTIAKGRALFKSCKISNTCFQQYCNFEIEIKTNVFN